jgi:hypothetical protein
VRANVTPSPQAANLVRGWPRPGVRNCWLSERFRMVRRLQNPSPCDVCSHFYWFRSLLARPTCTRPRGEVFRSSPRRRSIHGRPAFSLKGVAQPARTSGCRVSACAFGTGW